MLRGSLLLFLVLVLRSLIVSPTHAQERIPAIGNRDAAFVAETPGYRFYSDFWMNLHQYLYGISGGGPEERAGFDEEASDCIAALPLAEVDSWNQAVEYYRAHMAELPHMWGFMREVRYQLATYAPYVSEDQRMAEIQDQLAAAAPAYRTCLWDLHDARNRRRIGEWVGMLVRYARPLQHRLSIYYRAGWPEHVAVDVVGYVSFAGADTETRPGLVDHIMSASTRDDPTGFGGLETLLHESGHIMFGARHGAIGRALATAADSLGVPPPRGLWHALMFYTSGTLVRELALTQGVAYTPYWLGRGIYREYREPVEVHWQPYLDGERSLEDAVTNLVRAVTE